MNKQKKFAIFMIKVATLSKEPLKTTPSCQLVDSKRPPY